MQEESREEKVQRLKKAVQGGKYRIDPENIANGILSNYEGVNAPSLRAKPHPNSGEIFLFDTHRKPIARITPEETPNAKIIVDRATGDKHRGVLLTPEESYQILQEFEKAKKR